MQLRVFLCFPDSKRIIIISVYFDYTVLTQYSIIIEYFSDSHVDVLDTQFNVQILDVQVSFFVAAASAHGPPNQNSNFFKSGVESAISACWQYYQNSGTIIEQIFTNRESSTVNFEF